MTRSSVATSPADGEDERVLTTTAGTPLQHSSFQTHAWKKALAVAGVRCRFHDLRHTSVALAIAAGAHPMAIHVRMGHSTITVTLDRYGHLFPELDEAIASPSTNAGPKPEPRPASPDAGTGHARASPIGSERRRVSPIRPCSGSRSRQALLGAERGNAPDPTIRHDDRPWSMLVRLLSRALVGVQERRLEDALTSRRSALSAGGFRTPPQLEDGQGVRR